MNIRRVFGPIMVALFLCAPVARAQDTFEIPVDGEFLLSTLNWSDGGGEAYRFVWRPISVKGQLAICGAAQSKDPSLLLPSKNAMSKAFILVDGKTVLKDMRFFNHISANADLRRATAKCRLTPVPAAGDLDRIILRIPASRARM